MTAPAALMSPLIGVAGCMDPLEGFEMAILEPILPSVQMPPRKKSAWYPGIRERFGGDEASKPDGFIATAVRLARLNPAEDF